MDDIEKEVLVGSVTNLTTEGMRIGEVTDEIFSVTAVEVRRTALEMALEFHINDIDDARVADVIKTATSFEKYISGMK